MSGRLLQTPLALVGMACRLPGADNLDDYWDLLARGGDAVTELPHSRLDRELYYDPVKGTPAKTYSSLGGLVTERPLAPEVAERIGDLRDVDPCHQVLFDVTLEALQDTGAAAERQLPASVGVYVGHSSGSDQAGELAFATMAAENVSYLRDTEAVAALPADLTDDVVDRVVARLRAGRPRRHEDGGPHFEAHEAANVIARGLELDGPAVVVDAACSSSLVALALAAMDLQQGKIGAAIVGGASYLKADGLALFSYAQSCSASGSRPFDASADGLIAAEGYVVVVVKTLSRALADGDTIRAVIRGLGMSSDGRGRSLWAPRKEGQVEALRRAYGQDVDPGDIQYIEAHATSTQVGDATEVEALATFFAPLLGQRQIPIGSVKSNIGHTLESAGLAGLVKTVLALEHGVIPPTIHLERPNPAVDWPRLPFVVPDQPLAWPPRADGRARRAGVNAFGIGGINMHVVVDEFLPDAAQTPTNGALAPGIAVTPDLKGDGRGEVAIVGRGVILPGAHSVEAFAELLHSGRSELGDAPSDRWRGHIGVCAGRTGPWRSPTCRGGYVRDYVYDWRRHRVPPKQVARANPLQFMLLDATDQALREAGYDRKPFDRAMTAVVVGTSFAAEFGNQLMAGLRLPELRHALSQELRGHGLTDSRADEIADQFEARLLAAKPALLDETGGFTASSLASWVSKTLDLRGGFMALDAEHGSSLSSLAVACDLLGTGSASLVVCAAAQRLMDLSMFESLALKGRLPDQNAAGQHSLPGEGVALVLLKRLSDARRDGDPIVGIVRGVGTAGARAGTTASRAAAQRALDASGCASAEVTRVETALAEQIGHTQAAHGLATLIAATLTTGAPASAHDARRPAILATSTAACDNRMAFHALVEQGPDAAPGPGSPRETGPADLSRQEQETPTPPRARIVRFGAPDQDTLRARLERATTAPGVSLAGAGTYQFSSTDVARAAVVATDAEALATSLRLALAPHQRPEARTALEDKGVFWNRTNLGPEAPRIAFLCSGLGSQYPGMLRSLVARSPAARATRDEAGEILDRLGVDSFGVMAWDDPAHLDTDLWTIQASVLIADLMVHAALVERGIRPDVVAGHSYGEYPAMVVAGIWTLEQAIRATRVRAEAIAASPACEGRLLSILAGPDRIESLIARHGSAVQITHRNAPDQTVVGGLGAAVEAFGRVLAGERVAAHPVAVPAAFHTPLMQQAQPPLRELLASERLVPPTLPLLSNVTNRYEADPDQVKANLVAQLTSPVGYAALVQRLADDGVTAFVEVGPQQVLTRLNRQILGTASGCCIASDHPKRNAAEQLDRVQALVETIGAGPPAAPRSAAAPTADTSASPPGEIEHFDATLARRQRTRQAATSASADRAASGAAASSGPARETDPLETLLIDFVVDQTGYPPEVIELDADLEADLGIDSIKKAQLFGELREVFSLDIGDAGELRLTDFPTLRHVLDFMRTLGAEASPAARDATSREPVDAYEQGVRLGRAEADQIRRALRQLADTGVVATMSGPPAVEPGAQAATPHMETLRGVADGAQVLVDNLVAYDRRPDTPALLESLTSANRPDSAEPARPAAPPPAVEAGTDPPRSGATAPVASRYVMRMVTAAQRPGSPRVPELSGAALILGANSVGQALRDKLSRLGASVHLLTPGDDPERSVAELEALWDREPVLHLFLVTPRDQDADTRFDAAQWRRRRVRGVTTPYRVCQKWLTLVHDAGSMDDASLVAVTSLGGDFGFEGDVVSTESGALTGLLKAMVNENWVNGFRMAPVIKVIDSPPGESADAISQAVCAELAVPSFETEVAWAGGVRRAARAVPAPIPHDSRRRPRPGQTWVCTGGARGITAYAARELALRYGLKLHLLGTAPPPDVHESWRDLSDSGLQALRLDVMQAARRDGQSPITAWQQTEKALEIDRTLRDMRAQEIAVTYHSCDVGDRDQLGDALARVRELDGPIDGVLHGAGVGRDARFSRKDPARVDRCITAKVDGAQALMDLTRQDPLQHFIAFGSISGRFGANGQTDYSLANDMMAKQIDWYRRQRPDVRSVALHWHAWDDVGMSIKPETRLALAMIDMRLMPAAEGLAHLVDEIELGGADSEVLFTDDRYCRLFRASESVEAGDGTVSVGAPRYPLIDEVDTDDLPRQLVASTRLDPTTDPFLTEHRIDGKPLLPLVVGLELLCEAAGHLAGRRMVGGLRDVIALDGLRFHGPDPKTAKTRAAQRDAGSVESVLFADVCTRDGRLVERDRPYLTGTVDLDRAPAAPRAEPAPPVRDWHPVPYPKRSAKFYLGPPLRCLRKIQIGDDRAIGRIIAPAAVELASVHRDIAGWMLPSAALDACLYATGLLAWERVQSGVSLPVRLGRVTFGRSRAPGEQCHVETRFTGRADNHGQFEFSLFGCDGDRLIDATDYRIAWVS